MSGIPSHQHTAYSNSPHKNSGHGHQYSCHAPGKSRDSSCYTSARRIIFRRKNCWFLALFVLVLVMITELSAVGRYLEPSGWHGGGAIRWWEELKEQAPGAGLSSSHIDSSLPICPMKPPGLVGKIPVADTQPTWAELHSNFSYLKPGGRWKPSGCVAREKLALVIPYRYREKNLRSFLNHMHPYLQKQQIEYGVYVIEQGGSASFNRGLLLNIGFHHALKMYNYTCYAFHDVDMVPEMDNNLYRCSEEPIHLPAAQDRYKWGVPYASYFGGAELFSREQYIKINGYSNRYFGWGGEDDDLYARVKAAGHRMARYTTDVARYVSFNTDHYRAAKNTQRFSMVDEARSENNTMSDDGLNTMKYKLLDKKEKALYTWLYVDINKTDIM